MDYLRYRYEEDQYLNSQDTLFGDMDGGIHLYPDKRIWCGLSRNPSRSMQAPRPLLSLLIITLIIIGYKVILGNRP